MGRGREGEGGGGEGEGGVGEGVQPITGQSKVKVRFNIREG